MPQAQIGVVVTTDPTVRHRDPVSGVTGDLRLGVNPVESGAATGHGGLDATGMWRKPCLPWEAAEVERDSTPGGAGIGNMSTRLIALSGDVRMTALPHQQKCREVS